MSTAFTSTGIAGRSGWDKDVMEELDGLDQDIVRLERLKSVLCASVRQLTGDSLEATLNQLKKTDRDLEVQVELRRRLQAYADKKQKRSLWEMLVPHFAQLEKYRGIMTAAMESEEASLHGHQDTLNSEDERNVTVLCSVLLPYTYTSDLSVTAESLSADDTLEQLAKQQANVVLGFPVQYGEHMVLDPISLLQRLEHYPRLLNSGSICVTDSNSTSAVKSATSSDQKIRSANSESHFFSNCPVCDSDGWTLVFDTSVLLANEGPAFLERYTDGGYKHFENVIILIPNVVSVELDRMKSRKRCKQARQLIAELNQTVKNEGISRIVGQTLEAKALGDKVYKPEISDDDVLVCLIQTRQASNRTVVCVTNDVGLQLRARWNHFMVLNGLELLREASERSHNRTSIFGNPENATASSKPVTPPAAVTYIPRRPSFPDVFHHLRYCVETVMCDMFSKFVELRLKKRHGEQWKTVLEPNGPWRTLSEFGKVWDKTELAILFDLDMQGYLQEMMAENRNKEPSDSLDGDFKAALRVIAALQQCTKDLDATIFNFEVVRGLLVSWRYTMEHVRCGEWTPNKLQDLINSSTEE